jgi:hypothetical protein
MQGHDRAALDAFGLANAVQLEPEELRRVLTTIIERIELNPQTRELIIKYRLPISAMRP